MQNKPERVTAFSLKYSQVEMWKLQGSMKKGRYPQADLMRIVTNGALLWKLLLRGKQLRRNKQD